MTALAALSACASQPPVAARRDATTQGDFIHVIPEKNKPSDNANVRGPRSPGPHPTKILINSDKVTIDKVSIDRKNPHKAVIWLNTSDTFDPEAKVVPDEN